jgi:hypothetical protein
LTAQKSDDACWNRIAKVMIESHTLYTKVKKSEKNEREKQVLRKKKVSGTGVENRKQGMKSHQTRGNT